MYREYSIPIKSSQTKKWLIVGGVLAFGLFLWMLSPFVILAGLIARPKTEDSLPTPAPVSVTGWRVDLLGAHAESVPQFSGNFPPGKVLFLPANADFAIVTQPVDVRGELEESAISGAWKQHGGRISTGEATREGVRQLMRAPRQPGLYRFTWNSRAGADNSSPSPASSTLRSQTNPGLDVLVLAEAEVSTKGERTTVKVNGKTIGAYLDPAKSKSNLVQEHSRLYQIPRFFAVLTPETAKLRLGPDFELGNLIAYMDHMDKDGRKVFTTERHTNVLPIRMELIDKLVKLRERLQQKGLKVTRFGITSGFRTPDYNKSVRGASYSRHCYGDGVDIYIDENNNHHMDDLNGDKRFDRKDGLIIANACRELELEGAVVPGGIGLYEWTGDESVRSHVHIDCRGFISRWGLIDNKRSFTWWPAEEFQGEAGE